MKRFPNVRGRQQDGPSVTVTITVHDLQGVLVPGETYVNMYMGNHLSPNYQKRSTSVIIADGSDVPLSWDESYQFSCKMQDADNELRMMVKVGGKKYAAVKVPLKESVREVTSTLQQMVQFQKVFSLMEPENPSQPKAEASSASIDLTVTVEQNVVQQSQAAEFGSMTLNVVQATDLTSTGGDLGDVYCSLYFMKQHLKTSMVNVASKMGDAVWNWNGQFMLEEDPRKNAACVVRVAVKSNRKVGKPLYLGEVDVSLQDVLKRIARKSLKDGGRLEAWYPLAQGKRTAGSLATGQLQLVILIQLNTVTHGSLQQFDFALIPSVGEKTSKEGTLRKLKKTGGWQAHWVVVTVNSIVWYTGPDMKQRKGVQSLAEAVVEACEGEDGNPFCLRLQCLPSHGVKRSTVFFAADSEAQREEWMECCLQTVARLAEAEVEASTPEPSDSPKQRKSLETRRLSMHADELARKHASSQEQLDMGIDAMGEECTEDMEGEGETEALLEQEELTEEKTGTMHSAAFERRPTLAIQDNFGGRGLQRSSSLQGSYKERRQRPSTNFDFYANWGVNAKRGLREQSSRNLLGLQPPSSRNLLGQFLQEKQGDFQLEGVGGFPKKVSFKEGEMYPDDRSDTDTAASSDWGGVDVFAAPAAAVPDNQRLFKGYSSEDVSGSNNGCCKSCCLVQ